MEWLIEAIRPVFSVSGIEHGLAYRALADGVIDVTDAYSTDGELERYDLVLLNDSLSSFLPTSLPSGASLLGLR